MRYREGNRAIIKNLKNIQDPKYKRSQKVMNLNCSTLGIQLRSFV